MVSFSSPPKTFGHSLKARFVVITTERPLVSRADGIEEDLTASAVEGHEAGLVEDQDVDSFEPALVAAQLPSVSRLKERAHKVSRSPEGDVAALPRRLDAEGDRQVRGRRSDEGGRIWECTVLRVRAWS